MRKIIEKLLVFTVKSCRRLCCLVIKNSRKNDKKSSQEAPKFQDMFALIFGSILGGFLLDFGSLFGGFWVTFGIIGRALYPMTFQERSKSDFGINLTSKKKKVPFLDPPEKAVGGSRVNGRISGTHSKINPKIDQHFYTFWDDFGTDFWSILDSIFD